MRIYVHGVDSYLGRALCQELHIFDSKKHRLFGSLLDGNAEAPESVRRVVPRDPSKQKLLLKTAANPTNPCGLIVYHLRGQGGVEPYEEISMVVNYLKMNPPAEDKKVTLVVISSVMVWDGTPEPQPPKEEAPAEGGGGDGGDDDDIPAVDTTPYSEDGFFVDSHYEARIATSEKYDKWKQCEDVVLSLNGRERCRGVVIATGILYGNGEDSLHDIFRDAWLSKPTAEVVAPGTNVIPLCHVRDVARLVREMIIADNAGDDVPPYLFAVDKSNLTQRELVQGIVDKVCDSYPVPVVDKETTGESRLSLHLKIHPSKYMLADTFPWVAENGVLDNMELVAKEFCKQRSLRPIRCLFIGPPASGKTYFAAKVAEHFNIPHLQIKDVIQQCLRGGSELSLRVKEKLEEAAVAGASKRIPRELLTEIFLSRLTANVCKYRGFVLDGYPRSHEDAENLFLENLVSQVSEDEPPPEDDDEAKVPEKMLREGLSPDFVINLQANDAACLRRIQNMAPDETEATHFTPDGFARRVEEFRKRNFGDGPSVMEFFQTRDIEVLNVQAGDRDADGVFESIRIYMEKEGRPGNYLKSGEEVAAEIKAKEEEEEAAAKEREEKRKAAETAVKVAQQRDEEAQEVERLRLIGEHDKRAREPLGLTQREYMMKYLVPTVTEALVDICRIAPDDPVAYLANYLEEHADD
mmetsp:Transcript_22599/g.50938  ORF Transcript_22599/g.50938 Transcript_22599/m.50938 type:complete len:693 (+) Transcript_22599:62-2140(+)